MKVLFLAPQPFFQERGSPIRARNTLYALSEAGYSVDLLCYPFGDPISLRVLRVIRSPGVPGIKDVKVGPSLQKFPLDSLMFLKAVWLCLRHRYDVIQAVEEAAFFAVWLKILFPCKFIYNLDSFISDHLQYSGFLKSKLLLKLVRALERATIRRADLAVTVCQDLSRKVHALSPRTPILQLEDAPLSDEFEEKHHEAKQIRSTLGLGAAPVVLYAGNFGGYQGIELLIQAAARVRHVRPDVRFVLVGGDPESIDKMAELATGLGISENCLFVGRRPVDELGGYLTLADFLVSPRTRGTNTPLKIYDYMLSGRPIVATNLLTHTQVLDHTCAVLTESDPDAFARGILRLLHDKHHAKRLAAAATKRVKESYGLPIFKQKVRAAYQQLSIGLVGLGEVLLW